MATDTTVHSPQTAFSNVQRGHWEVSPEEIELGPKIGEGANAVIMKAKFRQQNCVAKMLKSGVSGNTQAYKDLIMELEILTSVTAHPNVVQFMGACIQTPEKPVVLEEYVDGPTLENFLQARRGTKLERRTIYGWSLDLLRALDFLHNRNPIIIHRDLKPANILLTRDLGSMKLTDFGMSKKVDRAVRDTKQHKGYTGTVRYMAPEVISCQTGNYTEKCDIYSASLILWYIATCQRPPPNDINKVNERPTVTWIAWPSYESLVTSMWAHAPEEVRISLEAYRTVIHVPSQ
jgi:serine/threonine protein kinase